MQTDVVFATMTLVRDESEAELLTRSLERLSGYGRRIVVTDGGSDAAFVDRVRALPCVDVRRSMFGPGLVGQIKTSLDAAAREGASRICYTEPDKLAFFDTGLQHLLEAPVPGTRFGVLVAARTPDAFDTFPRLQQYTERAINELTSEVVAVSGDYSYGPFIMSAALVPHVVAMQEDVGWGWRHFAFATAHRLGLTVSLHEGPFECPPGQRAENPAERLHRVRQLEQNSRGLLLAAGQA